MPRCAKADTLSSNRNEIITTGTGGSQTGSETEFLCARGGPGYRVDLSLYTDALLVPQGIAGHSDKWLEHSQVELRRRCPTCAAATYTCSQLLLPYTAMYVRPYRLLFNSLNLPTCLRISLMFCLAYSTMTTERSCRRGESSSKS